MIQEKDFLYRVPVKTALITTPGGQIINPEILVDLEGGEFMHGNILDANSTNKLVNQSVKEAVDNKIIECGHVIKDLLEAETTRATEQENSLKTLIGAETSARTKGDEDLSSKIKAEQTRAEGKEKEISEALNQQVDTLNTAIDTKQPKGNYLTEHQSLEEYAKKVELPTVPTKVSELQNDSEFIVKSVYDEKIAALEARIAALEAKHPEAAE